MLVIGSAGDKALNAALWGAGEVVAVDIRPAQVALLELKLAALATLAWPDAWALFAAGRHPDGARLYGERMRPLLSPGAREYWDRWIDIFGIGLHRHGWMGFGIELLAWAARRAASERAASAILASVQLRSQARIWRRVVRDRLLGSGTACRAAGAAMVHLLTVNEAQRRRLIRDRYVDSLKERIDTAMRSRPLRRNPYWWLAITGGPVAPADETDWLRPDGYAALRRRTAVVRAVCGDVTEVLAHRGPASPDAIDLFDVPDWLSEAANQALFAAAAHALRTGGRLVVRSAVRHGPAPDPRLFELDADCSRELTAAERTALYGSVCVYRRRAV